MIHGPASKRGIAVAFTWRDKHFPKEKTSSSQSWLGVLGFGGSNLLEQLGLYMKHEDEDEEVIEPMVALPDHLGINEEVEEGEID